jgi:DNA-binding beta-propeller fold protein YncE
VPGFARFPFAAALDFNRELPGAGVVSLAYVSHLDTGEVSLFRLSPTGELIFQRSRPVDAGVNQLAIHPPTGLVYAARRDAGFATGDAVAIVAPRLSEQDAARLEPTPVGELPVASFASGGEDLRSLAFGAGGDRLYVGAARPAAVVIFDTSLDDFGRPKNALLGRVALAEGGVPEQIRVVPQPGGGERVYVADSAGGRISVIDPELLDSPAPVDVIPVGRGPFGMAFAALAGGRRLFVTSLEEETVWVIDVDPASPAFHEVLYRIGAPRPARE